LVSIEEVHMPLHASLPQILRRLGFALLASAGTAAQAAAWHERSEAVAVDAVRPGTQLIVFQQGTEQARKVRSLSRQSYELAGGQPADMRSWFRSSWTDTELAFLTPLRADTGLIWGFSTGERGPKYRIDPGLQIGFLYLNTLGPRTRWSIRLTTLLGGRLRERACLADYGALGGVQRVNCRLAASELPPAETLRHLLNERPGNHTRIALRFSHDF
jgi:hypothetical protein